MKSTYEVFWAIMSPAVIVGGILLGIFTPTEAGAVAVLYSVIIGGLVVVLNLMIGLSTPPVGYLLYMTSALAEIKVEQVIREILPFLIVMLIILVMCTYWPGMVLFLPNLL